VHFGNNNFTRALALLSRKDLIARSLSCRYLAAHCYIKQGKYDQALSILGEDNPVHLITTTHNARRKLAHVNGNTSKHISQRGAKNHRDRIEASEERERDREQEKELRFQAGMCYLRGLCYAKRNAFDRARDCYKDAVRIDVQCFEAFEQLMKNSLMSPAEELAFLEELDFDSIRIADPSLAAEAADFTKLLYTTRLSKYASPTVLSNATETLSTHYNLAANPDLLLTRAETLYTQCRFHEALEITTSILNSKTDSNSTVDNTSSSSAASLGHSPNLYPLHLALLYETGAHNTLFHLSHTLSTHAPHESYTYLAIGTYYLSTARISEARRFFSKASLMDPHSAPAWIGFAHTFAAEGEHDQAIAAYSTAARLFQGSHLPQLFLGMQHLALNNMQLAWEYCVAAFEMSSGTIKAPGQSDSDLGTRIFNATRDSGGDPLVLNEIGVILYHQSNLPAAAKLFKKSLELAADLGCNMTAWVATRANLAHTLRRLNRLEEALAEFDECLRTATGGASPSTSLEPGRGMTAFAGLSIADGTTSNAAGSASGYDERNLIGSIHTSRGLVLLTMMGRTREAVMALHEAVRVLGGDAGGGGVAGTLLSRAMEIWALEEGQEDEDEEVDEMHSGAKRGSANANVNTRARRRGAKEPAGSVMSAMSNEKTVERQLDGDADEILDAALRSVR
jgi:anaphase-promoting complex subunit 6